MHGAVREDPEADELVALLLARSEKFAELWARHEVANRSGSIKRFLNTLVGTLTLDCQILVGDNAAERLVVFAPAPGSEDAAKLGLLAVVGTQQFAADPTVGP